MFLFVCRERLSAIECLQHHWFTDTEKLTVQPMQRPVKCSETITAKVEEVRVVKLSSPTISRKQDDITSQILSSHEVTAISKTSPTNVTTVTTNLSVHRSREISVPITKSSEISSVTSQGEKTEKVGMSFTRRSRFMKNMESLAQSYNDLTSTENNNIIDSKSTLEKMDNTLYSSYGQDKSSNVSESANVACKVESNTSTYISVRSVNKATAMQTMPVSDISRYRLSHPLSNTETVAKQRQQNQNVSTKTENEVPRRIMDNKDCVYTFRRCFIIDDSEDETVVGNSTAPILIHGSVPTSDNTHSYSDHSSSDSGSDTVSEMSIDSSSDRSSIISLDDSLLEYNYTKINGRPYPAGSYVSYSSANNNVWYSAGTLNAPRNERAPRYSCSETFSKAFARFSSISGDTQEAAMNKTQERSIFAPAPRKQFAKAAHTSVLNKVLVSSISNDNTSAIPKVDFLREHNGNIVVIREVKAGKYNRVSEVKCESVQSRIRKLQVQGAKP